MRNELEIYIQDTGNTWIPENVYKEFRNSYNTNEIVRKKGRVGNIYTVKKYAAIEEYVAERLVSKLFEPVEKMAKEVVEFYLDWYEKTEEIQLADEQKDAVIMVLNNPLSILTGGPGTGKTCVLKAIDAIFRLMGNAYISFLAPSGKAARRITESTGRTAMTVQKGMHYSPYGKKLTMFSADLIIIDEVSLMDVETMMYFLASVRKGTHILFAGDVDQLPSVGPGAILRDMIASGVIPVTRLLKTFRQKENSGIAKNIKFLQSGYAGLEQSNDFQMLDIPAEQAQKKLISLALENMKIYGQDGVAILTPYRRKGATCANTINALMQDIFTPRDGGTKYIETNVVEPGDSISRHVRFHVGNPVLNLENNVNVANGDVGKIVDVNEKGVTVHFFDGDIFYPLANLGQLTLAYALSIHKSQGSEYPCVISPLLPEHLDLLSRNVYYTAVTRAKKKFVSVGDHSLLSKIIPVESGYSRVTRLSEEIREEYYRRTLVLEQKPASIA